jgi:hypothetical protein
MVITPISMSDPFGTFKLLLLILSNKRCHQVEGLTSPQNSLHVILCCYFKPMAVESNTDIIIVNKTKLPV